MRTRRLVVALAAAGAALAASGFPLRQGLTRSEAAVSLPGDLLIPDPTLVADRAILIDAPPERVWPWLTQIGQDRGGFYSWTALENAIGCEMTDVDHLRPEWSTREVGEVVALAPGASLRVAVSDPGSALVLTSVGGSLPEGSGDIDADFTWTFALLPEVDGHTRLHARERYALRGARAQVAFRGGALASSVMSWRMLRRIRALAEAH